MRDKMLARLETMITQERLEHSLGVEKAAVQLAEHYGADTKKAQIAGLLHDCAKGCDYTALAHAYGVKLDVFMLARPKLAHAHIGAARAERDFGVKDRQVLNAIRWHTFARPGMSLLEKIIYVADYIEPGRDFQGVLSLRQLAFSDLDRAVLEGLRCTLTDVLERSELLHPQSVRAYNWYLKHINEGTVKQ